MAPIQLQEPNAEQVGEYGYSLKDVINLLDPKSNRRAPVAEPQASTRTPRQVKFYKSPNTGEIVETKGGNHKTLKEWRAEHGFATVESWLTKGVWFEHERHFAD